MSVVNPVTAACFVEILQNDKHVAGPRAGGGRGGLLLFFPGRSIFPVLTGARFSGWGAAIQTAAASSLGKMLVHLCKAAGLPLINIVRRPEQVASLVAVGAALEDIVDTSADGWQARLAARAAALKATCCFDAVGGPAAGAILSAMPRDSVLYLYGALDKSGKVSDVDIGQLLFQNKTVRGFWTTQYLKDKNLFAIMALTSRVAALCGQGDLPMDVRRAPGGRRLFFGRGAHPACRRRPF